MGLDDPKELMEIVNFNPQIKTEKKKKYLVGGQKKVVGIISVPLSPNRKYYQVCGDSYISIAHIQWLKDHGMEVLAIPYTTDNHEWYFERINGLYLPSGGVFATNSKEYYKCCKKFINLAIQANDNGDYFPIWGACMGMQQMIIVADGHDNMEFLERFDSFNNLMLPLIFTDDGLESKIMKKAVENNPQFVLELMTNDCTLNNHMMGISPEKMRKSKSLWDFYNIISYNYDRQGKVFVSTMEAKNYPFYGVQWHPERAPDMNYFAEFLAEEVYKNKHTTRAPLNEHMQHKKIDCMTYSGNIYKKCNFYWHSKTTKDNQNKCSAIKLGSPTNNGV
jgi:gamma-glutamyl hydrolase